jgi:hypothetical protein
MKPTTATPPTRTPAEAAALASINHPQLRQLADRAMRAAADRDARGDVPAPTQARNPERDDKRIARRDRDASKVANKSTPPRLAQWRASKLLSAQEARAARQARRAELRERRQEKARARDARLHARMLAKLKNAPHQTTNAEFATFIGCTTWRDTWSIVGDQSGRLAMYHLGRIKNRVAAGMILKAAFWNERDAHWGNPRTRRIVALGLALLWLSRPTSRKYGFTNLVLGVPQGAFRKLLANPFDPYGRSVSRSALSNDGDHVGYLSKLRDAGFMYGQQLDKVHHADKLERCELVGPSGHATNRYWVVSRDPLFAFGDDDRRKRAIDAVIFINDVCAWFWSQSRPPP